MNSINSEKFIFTDCREKCLRDRHSHTKARRKRGHYTNLFKTFPYYLPVSLILLIKSLFLKR